jgi:hypothetical protein
MASGFNDLGYYLSGTWYTVDNQVVSNTNINTSDIYNTTLQCGVYMCNGKIGTSSGYPIAEVFCSTTDLRKAGVYADADDGWLVYPGYGFILYTLLNFGGVSSRPYVNTSDYPQFFYCASGGYNNSMGTRILQPNGQDYPFDSAGGTTSSAKIYFRGSEIIINGLYV